MKKIVIYGGAFNPPHIGHASVIEAIIRLFSCDEIWILPSSHRHDKKILIPGKNRIEMLRLLIEELFPNSKVTLKISALEVDKNVPTITYETLRELKSLYPDSEFYFAIGSDLLSDIEKKWINGKKIYKEVNFVAIKKPIINLPERLPPNITVLNDMVWLNVSSTFVKKIIAKGHPGIPYLTPKIANYIQKNNLYI